MKPYAKIPNIFMRDPETVYKTLIWGYYSNETLYQLRNSDWEFTEKVDGTNIRVIVGSGGAVEFRGRSDKAQVHPELLAWLWGKFGQPGNSLRSMLPIGACLYGEGYGAGIQKGGGKYSPEKQFVLFDVMIDEMWLSRSYVYSIAERLGIQHVPVICENKPLEHGLDIVRCGLTSRWGSFQAEGLVARPVGGVLDRVGRRIVCKIKSKDMPQRPNA